LAFKNRLWTHHSSDCTINIQTTQTVRLDLNNWSVICNGLIILNDCDQGNYFLHYFQHFQVVILCSFYLKQCTATRLWFFPLISMDTTKMKYLQTIGVHRINVATFSVTNRSISSTKKKIDFFKHTWSLNDYLATYYYVVPRILGHPVYCYY
jgi:hypothetical protein